jgi:hypothetical protein
MWPASKLEPSTRTSTPLRGGADYLRPAGSRSSIVSIALASSAAAGRTKGVVSDGGTSCVRHAYCGSLAYAAAMPRKRQPHISADARPNALIAGCSELCCFPEPAYIATPPVGRRPPRCRSPAGERSCDPCRRRDRSVFVRRGQVFRGAADCRSRRRSSGPPIGGWAFRRATRRHLLRGVRDSRVLLISKGPQALAPGSCICSS